MPDLASLKRDLGVFAKAIGYPLADWQLAALALDTRVMTIMSRRVCEDSR